MSQKKIFLICVAISTVSLLLHHGGHLSWTIEAFHLSCPGLRSLPLWGLKPKHTNVAFLKTHKTASSTMQNLLFRFAERNNVTVALPVQACSHQFCYPHSFTPHFVHPHTIPPNIITSHMRFNKAELQRLMPNDTIYITILREPGSMFESLFSYYNQYCQSFKRVPNGSLEAFLEEPWRYYRPDEKDSMYARNTVTFDLGGDKDRPATDVAYAQTFLGEVERVFSLVMIAEYFDESLVLLRHLLSWDLDDILYVKLNMRTTSSKRSLTPSKDPFLEFHRCTSLRPFQCLVVAPVVRSRSCLCSEGSAPPSASPGEANEKLLRWTDAPLTICHADQEQGPPPLEAKRESRHCGLRPSSKSQPWLFNPGSGALPQAGHARSRVHKMSPTLSTSAISSKLPVPVTAATTFPTAAYTHSPAAASSRSAQSSSPSWPRPCIRNRNHITK